MRSPTPVADPSPETAPAVFCSACKHLPSLSHAPGCRAPANPYAQAGDRLLEFLHDRLAETERLADTIGLNSTSTWRWEPVPEDPSSHTRALCDERGEFFRVDLSGVFPQASVIAHIAAHDPVHVIADCRAKREVMDDYLTVLDLGRPRRHRHELRALRRALIGFARVYADHPDYPRPGELWHRHR